MDCFRAKVYKAFGILCGNDVKVVRKPGTNAEVPMCAAHRKAYGIRG